MITWVSQLTGIKSADTGKYNLIYTNSLLTYIPCDVIVHMVVLRKLAMPAADGVFYIIKANISQYFSNQTKILSLLTCALFFFA